MALIKINISDVISGGNSMNAAKGKILSVKSSVSTIRYQIDGNIRNRSNIDARVTSAINLFSTIESRIQAIKNVVDNGANNYNNTDASVYQKGRVVSQKLITVGKPIVGISGAILAQSSKDKKTSWAEQFWKDDWKPKGAVVSGSVTGETDMFGIEVGGTAEGDLLGGSVKTSSKAKWDLSKGDVTLEKKIEAEAHLAQGKLSGNIGLLNGSVKGTVGSVGATGAFGASLFKNRKLSPAITAKAEAEAALLKGEANAKFGNDDLNAHGKASGSVLGAKAEASAGIGKVSYKDSSDNVTTGFGVTGKVGAEAYLAQGKVSGGLTILGVKIDVGLEGKAGGAGVQAGGAVTTGGISGSIGAGLVLGAGLSISIDWSDFKFW